MRAEYLKHETHLIVVSILRFSSLHFLHILYSGPESANIDRAVGGRDPDETRPEPTEFRQHTQFPERQRVEALQARGVHPCLLYTSPSPRDISLSRMPSSA